VHREASADHECPHGCVFPGQAVRLVCEIGLVRPSVHQGDAREAGSVLVKLVGRVSPSTTAAKAYNYMSVSHWRSKLWPTLIVVGSLG
jgi:hypothetical protein